MFSAIFCPKRISRTVLYWFRGPDLHVPVNIVQGLLDNLERGEKVIGNLQVAPLDLSPEIPPVLEVVLLEEGGKLLEGIHSVLVALQLGVQDLLELPGEDGVSFWLIADLRHPGSVTRRGQ